MHIKAREIPSRLRGVLKVQLSSQAKKKRQKLATMIQMIRETIVIARPLQPQLVATPGRA